MQDVDNFIRNFEASKIKTIKIIRDKYFLSGMYFKGVIIIETLNSNFYDGYSKEYFKELILNSGNFHKSYYNQNYSSASKYEDLPDMRTQLLWEPQLSLIKSKNIDFYTSDVKGVYEISVQGISNDGEMISYFKNFKVE